MGTRKNYKWSKWGDLAKLTDYVVLDVETTGLSHNKDKIIEIAIARISSNSIVDEFHSLVNPERNLSNRVVKLTGITDSDLASAPLFQNIAQQVVDFIGGSVILAHNAPFDAGFLEDALRECGFGSNFTYLDTVRVAKAAYPDLKDHKLETLITELGLAEKQTHRAMDDVHCTIKLFQTICQKYNNPLVAAISACCSPITSYRIDLRDHPLDGLRIALVGTFTFAYSAAKKLITVAGGTLVNRSSDFDYLVYGFLDPLEYDGEFESLSALIKTHQQAGTAINEVGLFKLCGVTFYDNYDASDPLEAPAVMKTIDTAKMLTDDENTDDVAESAPAETEEVSSSSEEISFLNSMMDRIRESNAMKGGMEELLRFEPNRGYTSVFFYNLTAFRIKLRKGQQFISIPTIFRDLIPTGFPTKKLDSEQKYIRVLIDNEHPVETYTSFLVRVVGECANRYPKEWDCCSRYMACSDAKTCVHPDKVFALECGYRKILNSGRIFYGKNRNID